MKTKLNDIWQKFTWHIYTIPYATCISCQIYSLGVATSVFKIRFNFIPVHRWNCRTIAIQSAFVITIRVASIKSSCIMLLSLIIRFVYAERFLSTVVTQLNDVSFSREVLTSLHFTDTDITYVFMSFLDRSTVWNFLLSYMWISWLLYESLMCVNLLHLFIQK